MIEEVVPPLAQGSLASRNFVETSTDDHVRPAEISPELLDRPDDDLMGLEAMGDGSLTITLPESVLDELRWVAAQERCDVVELVVNAVDEFLADHWVRNSEF